MKDIKLNNKVVVEKVERITALFESANPELRADGNSAGKYMLAAMFASTFIYLFFVTSSIFYAVNTQKYAYEIEQLNTLALEVGYNLNTNTDTEFTVQDLKDIKEKKDRISYINKNADTAIFLK
jgi:hypothetical protein